MSPVFRDETIGNLLSRLAESLPGHDALIYGGGRRHTFATLEREARVVARGLMALGVEQGERVVVWATNVPEWIVLQFAVAKLGAILAGAHTAASARDLEHLLTQCEAGTVVTIAGFRGHDYVGMLRDAGADRGRFPSVKRLLYVGAHAPAGFVHYASLRELAEQIDDAALDDRAAAISVDDPVNMQFTSGTTGLPKCASLSSRGVVNNAAAVGAVLGLTPADRLCLCVPMFHAFGYAVAVLGCYTHGAAVCLVDHFDARQVLQTIDRERCTVLHGVPTMFEALLACPQLDQYDLSSLRTGITAGAPCSPSLMGRIASDLHLPEMTASYGLTEASPGITITARDAPLHERSVTVGQALPDMEISIVDPATRRPVKPGERGELRVRGYNVMLGYFGDEAATRAVRDDEGWLYTGDEASVDLAGVYRITGRLKDVIISGGENIAPLEVENCLREHPAVVDAAVYGVPDAVFGERVAAAIRCEPHERRHQVTDEAVIAWCRARLAPFKVPTAIRFMTEFPMTPSGKVQKLTLREQHLRSVAVPSR